MATKPMRNAFHACFYGAISTLSTWRRDISRASRGHVHAHICTYGSRGWVRGCEGTAREDLSAFRIGDACTRNSRGSCPPGYSHPGSILHFLRLTFLTPTLMRHPPRRIHTSWLAERDVFLRRKTRSALEKQSITHAGDVLEIVGKEVDKLIAFKWFTCVIIPRDSSPSFYKNEY